MFKKIISLLMLLLFTFNLVGYRLLVYYGQQQNDLALEASFDADNYQQKDVFIIAVPLNLHYAPNLKDFERFDGEVSYKGKLYKYIKRKVYNSKLILVCLPNVNKMRLENIGNSFFKSTAGDQDNTSKKNQNHKNDNIKKLASDYDNFISETIAQHWQNLAAINYFGYAIKLKLNNIETPTQPPQIG